MTHLVFLELSTSAFIDDPPYCRLFISMHIDRFADQLLAIGNSAL